jgi:hypothetical protein
MELEGLIHQIRWLVLASAPFSLGEVSAAIASIFWRGKLSVSLAIVLDVLYAANFFFWTALLCLDVKRRRSQSR